MASDIDKQPEPATTACGLTLQGVTELLCWVESSQSQITVRVVLARILYGLTFAEIAERYGLQRKAVTGRWQRAVKNDRLLAGILDESKVKLPEAE